MPRDIPGAAWGGEAGGRGGKVALRGSSPSDKKRGVIYTFGPS